MSDGHHHEHDDDHAGHHADEHGHGHGHDQGWTGMARYLRMFPRMWRSPVSDAVVELVRPQPGELVVDLAAGMGPATVRAAASGAQVLAVDPTPGMRRILGLRRLVQPSAARAMLSVHDGAAESMPLAPACVDALWSVNAMHHWTDRSLAFAELARVMRPGGRIVLLDEDFADPAHPEHAAHQERRHSHHFDLVEPDGIAAGLDAVGFSIDEAGRRAVAGRPAVVVRAHRR